MKQGRDIFAKVIAAECGVAKAIGKLKGRELAALLRHVEGLDESDPLDEVIGMVMIVAGGRYLARVERKAARKVKARRAGRIL